MTYRIIIFDARNITSVIQPFNIDKDVATSYDYQGDAVWSAIQLRTKFKRSDIAVLDTNWKSNKRKHSFVLLPGIPK